MPLKEKEKTELEKILLEEAHVMLAKGIIIGVNNLATEIFDVLNKTDVTPEQKLVEVNLLCKVHTSFKESDLIKGMEIFDAQS